MTRPTGWTPPAATTPPAGQAARKVTQVGVVIPAHNEERHLGHALAAVRAAVGDLELRRPGTSVCVVVVLDACTDLSATVAGAFAAADRRVTLLDVDFRSVGRSRRAGIQAVLAGTAAAGTAEVSAAASATWIANTDADSRVPLQWLTRQLDLADAGADAVLGSVEPDAEGMDAGLLQRWHARHRLQDNHPHVYGANLGVRASAYLAAGGFATVESGEDRTLVRNLRSGGAVIAATDSNRVVTSGRLEARAPRGFAAYLMALALEARGAEA